MPSVVAPFAFFPAKNLNFNKIGHFFTASANLPKGAFTLARLRAQFRTKLAHLEMKNIFFILQNVQA